MNLKCGGFASKTCVPSTLFLNSLSLSWASSLFGAVSFVQALLSHWQGDEGQEAQVCCQQESGCSLRL